MPARRGFTQTQDSFQGAVPSAEGTANGNLRQLGAQNQHIKDFGAQDPLPSINFGSMTKITGTTWELGLNAAWPNSPSYLTWQVGDKIAIQGVSPGGYNGYYAITALPDSGTNRVRVQFDIGTNPGTNPGALPGQVANVWRPLFTGTGSSALDNLMTDMLGIRAAGGFIVLTMNKSPVILTVGQAGGDTKVDPVLGSTNPSQPANAGWDAFADLAYEIVARYVNNNQAGSPLYVQWWNELKGMYGNNRWDYEGYTTFYNIGWNKIRNDARGLIAAAGKNPAAGTDILIGGPYVHINAYLRTDTVPNHTHSNNQIGSQPPFFDMQGPDVIDYFTAFAAGYDFICFDGGMKYMDLYEQGFQGGTGGFVPTNEGMAGASNPLWPSSPIINSYTTGGTLKQSNVQNTPLTTAATAQSWQDIINWIVGTVFPGNGALNNATGVRPTKPIWISELHVGNATGVSTALTSGGSGFGNRQISDANMGTLMTAALAKVDAASNSATSVILAWGSESRTNTHASGNDSTDQYFPEVDYPNVVYPTNKSGGGGVTPLGTALGIVGTGVTIVGDGPSGH